MRFPSNISQRIFISFESGNSFHVNSAQLEQSQTGNVRNISLDYSDILTSITSKYDSHNGFAYGNSASFDGPPEFLRSECAQSPH